MNRVVVTGLGFISSIGNSRAEVLSSLREQRTGIAPMDSLIEAKDRVTLAGTVKGFEFPNADSLDWKLPEGAGLSRTQLRTATPNSIFAVLAMQQAIAEAGLSPELVSHFDTGLYCASAGSSWMTRVALESVLSRGSSRTAPHTVVTGMPNSLHLNLASHFAIKGATLGFSSACASSAHALGHAADLIRLGRQKIMFVVGAEDCHPCNILPFASLRALSTQTDPALTPRPFDRHRDGFVITGGAAVLVLEDEAHARTRGATIQADFLGWGQASDGHDVVAPDPMGNGLARAMANALGDAQLSPADIHYINAHATGTTVGDLAELRAIKSVFTGEAKPNVSSTKALTGHGLSLAGALEAAICCLAIQERFTPVSANITEPDPACEGINIVRAPVEACPRTAMSNSSGFGGSNVAIVLSAHSM